MKPLVNEDIERRKERMSKFILKALLAAVLLVCIITGLVLAGVIPAYIHTHTMPPGIISYGNSVGSLTIPTNTEGFGIKKVPVGIEDNNGRPPLTLTCHVAPGKPLIFEYEPVTYSSLGTPIGFYSGIRLLKVEGCFTGRNGVSSAKNMNSLAVPIAINGGVPVNAGRVQTLTLCLDLQKSGQVTIYALQRGLVAQGEAVAICL
jgi:hypothetical protein